VNWADMYAGVSNAPGVGQATGPLGPNQSIVTGPGQVAPGGGQGAAFSWLALMAGLVLVYLLVKMGARVSTPMV
jgi:hypothetical protein